MANSSFFPAIVPITVAAIAERVSARIVGGNPGAFIDTVGPIDTASQGALTFLDNPKYLEALSGSRASACFVVERHAARVPQVTCALVVAEPYRAFAQTMAHLVPAAMRPDSMFGTIGLAPGAVIHPSARLEARVVVDAGAIIGPNAEIGADSIIAAGAVIGPNVCIGRWSAIGPNASIQHAFIGNRVIVHAGVRIGQDGFGFAMGPAGHLKVPQLGRVIIQDDVEIGANTSIDRGANRDTVIGEGTKIDNLVQIGHNVVIGRHCIIVSQVGIAGSTTLEDFVALGAKVGVIGHVRIGMGAQIAATSNVNGDVPAGARWGGTPAKPVRDWFREVAALKRLGERDDPVGAKNG